MSRVLTKQELHNLAMNTIGKELEEKGFEFIAINSKLGRHPQFVCVDKNNQRYFVLVKAVTFLNNPNEYDVVWMETFKNHALKNEAKVYFAGVGLINAEDETKEVLLNEPYILNYSGIQDLSIQQN